MLALFSCEATQAFPLHMNCVFDVVCVVGRVDSTACVQVPSAPISTWSTIDVDSEEVIMLSKLSLRIPEFVATPPSVLEEDGVELYDDNENSQVRS